MRTSILLLALTVLPAAAPAQNTTLIRNTRVFDGVTTHQNTDVLFSGGVITRIGRNIASPAQAIVIDGSGKTLLPGLIDAHTHVFGDALVDAVVFGVTTELDMFTEPAFAQRMRAEQRAGGADNRADLFSAGVLVTAPGGHGTEYGFTIPTITTPDSAQAFVDARLKEGSDYIKLVYDDGALFQLKWPTLSAVTMRAVIEAAHKRDKLAIVHVSTLQAAQEAIAAGADGLVHLFVDTIAPSGFIDAMRRQKAFAIPTLVVLKSITGVGGGAQLVEDARLLPYLSPAARNALRHGFPNRPGSPRKDYEFARATVQRLQQAGVTILAGTDAPNPGTSHGAAMHRELELLVEAGLSPVQALAAATTAPADVFGLADRGRIASGKRADLLLVDGDPTVDITATRAIAGVWKGGQPVDRATYARRNAEVIATANRAPAALAAGKLSDFENNTSNANFGTGWVGTTDRMAGGTSIAEFKVADGGAVNTAKSLLVTGTVNTKFAYPWSGVMWSPAAQPMQPADLSSKQQIRFWAKGDGGTYRIMIFAQSRGNVPVERTFVAGTDWTEHVFKWSDFELDGKGIMAIIFTAGPKGGDFSFQLDEIVLQ